MNSQPPEKSEPSPVPPLVKVETVASYLSVSRQTIHNLIDSGDLKGTNVGSSKSKRRHVRITRDSLLHFYEKRCGHSLERALTHVYEP